MPKLLSIDSLAKELRRAASSLPDPKTEAKPEPPGYVPSHLEPMIVATPENLKKFPGSYIKHPGYDPIGGYFYLQKGNAYGAFRNENSPEKGTNYLIIPHEDLIESDPRNYPQSRANASHQLPEAINILQLGVHGIPGHPDKITRGNVASDLGGALSPFWPYEANIHSVTDNRCEVGGACPAKYYPEHGLSYVTNRYAGPPGQSQFNYGVGSLTTSNSAPGNLFMDSLVNNEYPSPRYPIVPTVGRSPDVVRSLYDQHNENEQADVRMMSLVGEIIDSLNFSVDSTLDDKGDIPVKRGTEKWPAPRKRKGVTGNW